LKPDKHVNPELDTKVVNLLEACLKNDRQGHKMFYQHFYAYAMSICLRYTKDRLEATEVLNEGFMKVFTKLRLYDRRKSLKGWIRRVMINTAIDYYRYKRRNTGKNDQLEDALNASTQEATISNISYDEIIAEIQELTPAYRTVFNLYVIDGYTHEEIAGKLDISVGSSKSNLSRARAILQKKLAKLYEHEQLPR
jgi:RNA polymerase sigma factor (sigma-70 family)